MKVIDVLIGARVSPEVEDIGLDIGEHEERAYSD
jgi:Amt family ammonium transporter